MPYGYEETRLWKESLGIQENDSYEQPREQLRVAFHTFREHAALLAAEIPRDLAEFTVHDVTHLDALWEMANIIGGSHLALTPTEAFVLGGAFLIHDLGMGLAAWPGGLEDLTRQDGWDDILASALANLLGRPPDKAALEAPSEEAVTLAKEIALREQHALHAADLALINWHSSASGQNYHLIENVDLRGTYGRLIGEIAASHWWNIEKVAEKFPGTTLGAPVTCPDDWTVDALKLACIMRCADAAHLDARRAPGFLRAVRKPSPYSDLHWVFQGYLQRPRVEDDRLVYTSVRAFDYQDAPAWWVAFESLKMVDGELRKVDALLADRARPRFRARSVKGVDDPTRLAELIPTNGWTPVDARVNVSNVAGLIQSLGGSNLYGSNPQIALRELIQNARDATRALGSIYPAAAAPIQISLREEVDGWWLSVTDSGIGMSQSVMTGPLLDFGRSYWGSYLMRQEAPGLASSGFAAAGRYGIGFYSVFMLGDVVRVVSRRYDEASAATRALDFVEGLSTRPILRPARRDEVRLSGGTTVAVRLRVDPFQPEGLLQDSSGELHDLSEVCANAAPALDCDVTTQFNDEPAATVVCANDWLTAPGQILLPRLSLRNDIWSHSEVTVDDIAERLRPLVVGDKTVGRISLAPSPPAAVGADGSILDVGGIAVVGGLASGRIGGLAGVVLGVPKKADRATAKLSIPPSVWKEWATEQAELWADYLNDRNGYEYDERAMSVALIVRLEGDTGRVAICHDGNKYLTANEIVEWARDLDRVVLVSEYSCDCKRSDDGFEAWDRDDHRFFRFNADVLRIDTSGRYGDWDAYGDPRPDKRHAPEVGTHIDISNPYHWWYVNQLELGNHLLGLVAQAWACSLDEVLGGLTGFGREHALVEIGTDAEGQPVETSIIEWIAVRPISGATITPTDDTQQSEMHSQN